MAFQRKENDMEIFQQRRFWVAVIPAAVLAANAFGVPLTAETLNSTGDLVVTAAMSALSLLSLFKPKTA
jgi:uncharacterized membrane protein